MKKNKLITISILGMLLLVPFMIPTVAAPASYVSVAEEEQHSWIMYIHFSNYVQWDTDNMSAAFTAIYGVDDFGAVRAGWGLIPTPPQAYWPVIINEINPEVTTDFLSAAFIPDNITHTPLSVTFGYNYWTGGLTWPTTWRIVNDTDSFAKQNLFGGMAISPTWVQDVQFGPNNINWATFVATANWGLGGGYWPHPLTANTTVTEITNGYQLSVPVSGYAIPGQFNNTMPITINVTYNTDGILQAYTMEYGTDLLYGYYHYQYFVDAVAPETTSPSDIVGLYNPPYTGLNITWTATDMHPENYTITRDGTPVVTTTPWVNGTPVVYNITDGLPLGNHTFEITFWDTFAHSTTDSVKFIVFVPDDIDPVLTSTPSDIVIDIGEYGDTFSWTATDDYHLLTR